MRMKTSFPSALLVLTILLLVSHEVRSQDKSKKTDKAPKAQGTAKKGDTYKVDETHLGITFMIEHAGVSWTHGRFNKASGDFEAPTAKGGGSFSLKIDAASIDTNSKQRDEHLRGPDFLNVKQNPSIVFTSKSVTPVKEGYKVSGDLSLHGEKKPFEFILEGGKTTEFPPGVQRIGYSTEFVIDRTEFGMDKMTEAIGKEIRVWVSFEGTKQ